MIRSSGWIRFRRGLAPGLALFAFGLGGVGSAHAVVGDHRWSAGYAAGGGVAFDGAGNVAGAGTFFGRVESGVYFYRLRVGERTDPGAWCTRIDRGRPFGR